MKKLICILLLVCMTACAAAESIDISGLSYSDLITLRNRISEEIIRRPEWKEVEIPAGQWIVGEDIPAGTYCISVKKTQALVRVWKRAVDDYKDNGLYLNTIVKENSSFAKIKLEEGWIFDPNRTVFLSPAASLGF